MTKILMLTVFLSAILSAGAWGTAKHEEKDGLLEIEAEDMGLRRPWKTVSDPKASGGKYMSFAGRNCYGKASSGRGSVKFTITTTGRYQFQFVMRQPDKVESDKSNDCWVDFSGVDPIDANGKKISGPIKVFGRGKGAFNTCGSYDVHKHNPSKGKLYVQFDKPGAYTLKLAGRSSLFQLDKVILKLQSADARKKKRKKR